MRINTTALLSVDMQPTFLNQLPKADSDVLLARHEALITFCVQRDIPVVHIEYNSYREQHLGINVMATLLDASLPLGTRRYHHMKSSQNAFAHQSGEDLMAILRVWGISRVVLTGVFAQQCVLLSGFGARKNGLYVDFDPTAISDPSPSWERVTLATYAHLGTIDTFENLMR